MNGEITYSIEKSKDSNLFAINSKSGVVSLIGSLDRERRDEYELIAIATDGGEPVLFTKTKIRIKVSDINDETPAFSSDKVTMDLSEDTKVGQIIHTFEAFDKDNGENGRVRYAMGIGGSVGSRSLLNVDPLNGQLTLSGNLDREVKDSHEFNILAIDNGSPQRTGTVSVTINVKDVNDNSPIFTTPNLLVSVAENTPIGRSVHRFDATDPDQGNNGTIEYSLKGTDKSTSAFTINSITGELLTNTELDREEKDSYNIVIVATDKGTPIRRSSQKLVKVAIEDVNDNYPEIVSLNTALLLPGNTPKGTTLMRVHAEDSDASSNGKLTYEAASNIQSKASNLFRLDRDTGELRLKADLDLSKKTDFDKQAMYFPVIVRDDAVPSERKSATTTLTIVAPGYTEPGPSFTTEIYTATLKENTPIGTPVGTVGLVGRQEFDADEPISFYIVGCESERRGKERGLFTIDSKSGQIRTARKIDREVEGNLARLNIVALVSSSRDENSVTMSGCEMRVDIIDENDTPPKFDDSFAIKLSEAFNPGHIIATVKARDDDHNPDLTYSVSLSAQAFLKIGAKSGVLTLTRSIDREEYASLEVGVQVSDGLHSVEWKQQVEVEDINDNAPIFSKPQYSFDVAETAERGTFIGRVNAFDLDLETDASVGSSGQISYSFISNSGGWGVDTFALNPSTGVITLSSSNGLDYELAEHYILTVSASDGGGTYGSHRGSNAGALTATATVYVNVLDVNDNDPETSKPLYEATIQENSLIGSQVVTIEASDRDSSEITKLGFVLEDSAKDIFDILNNGTIVTNANLNRETTSFYAFQVTVTDNSDIRYRRTATCLVEVTVQDINDHPPEFEDLELSSVTILENSPPNTPIVTVSAFDRDEGLNAEVEYLLEDSEGGRFSVGRIDGVLRSVKSLDREERLDYHLSVTAVDNGSPNRLSSKVEVVVNVIDMNDNAPEFLQKKYSANVNENASLGMDILETSAKDLDLGDNGNLRYSIISGDRRGDFLIDDITGTIRVAKELDYERHNIYELTIQVEDGRDQRNNARENSDEAIPGTGVRFDTASVTINIFDTNDNRPIFEHSPYTIRLLEENSILNDGKYLENINDHPPR